MLVFFIHGVATRNVRYAEKLQNLIKNEFIKQGKTRPYFYASFWGDLLKETDKIWRNIEDNLVNLTQENASLNSNDIFRYQEVRQGFVADFFGDALTYFNNEKGIKVRQIIAQQLSEYIEEYSQGEDLHIIAHSLGSVILWDILFSERFNTDDPAWLIKDLINPNHSKKKVSNLKSVTTLGSPILYFNMMLGITKERFLQVIKEINLQSWINVIHRSDLVAYPLEFYFSQDNNTFKIKDQYLMEDANLAETTAYNLGQLQSASAFALTDAHIAYWQNQKTAEIIVNNIQGNIIEITKSI